MRALRHWKEEIDGGGLFAGDGTTRAARLSRQFGEAKMSSNKLLDILDLARWAPSGDNTQSWRFEIIADDGIAIHGHDTRKDVIYDLDGHTSHMA